VCPSAPRLSTRPFVLNTSKGIARGEHQVPDQAQQAEREAPRAQQGRDAAKKLDKAASKGVIHKNQAANRKSAIAKKAAAL
jgi:small subunit ribosomal protein S20